MDGITAVAARVAEIQSRMASLRAPSVSGSGSGTAFADALSAASASGRSAAATSPSQSAFTLGRPAAIAQLQASAGSTALTADGAPVALAAYGNGKVPAAALQQIGADGHRLWAPAAQAFDRMQAAATRDGVTIGVTDSYRSYEAQVDVAARKGLYSEGGLAAKPGTSDHGWGRAVDLDLDSRAQAWMRANGAEFGFVEDTPREPWHWAFTPRG